MWIPSKLSRPSYTMSLIARERIKQRLTLNKPHKLILLRAPAGYGKTALAVQFVEVEKSVGWYNIDENDNLPYRFAGYFVAALNEATSQSCKSTLKLAEQNPQLSVMELLTDALKQISKHKANSYLVLDDFHHIQDPEIHQAMKYFIKLMPDNLTLLITSRSMPPLGISNLRIHGLVIEIEQNMLAFDVEETRAFLEQRIDTPLEAGKVEQLFDYVEGWPSALELIAWQTRYQNHSSLAANTQPSELNQTHLWEYLIEEVFANTDQDTQRFLLQCSVLDRFNHTLAAIVTKRSDAQSMIENLQRFGLFIQPIQEQYNWFRFHSLFKEFLVHERKVQLIDQELVLHQTAAQAWLAHANPKQALWHAEQADCEQMLVEILQQSGWQLFNSGELEYLQQILSHLSSEQIYRNATLCLLHAWIAQSQQRHEDVELILHHADSSHLATNNSDIGEFNALKAQIAVSKNQPELALQLAELALSQVDGQAFHSRIVATSVIGEVNHVLGYLDRALPLMQQTEKLARQYQVHHQALWAIAQQSEILVAKGYLQAAFDVQESGFKLIEDQHLNQDPLYEFLLRVRAQLLFSWNRLEEAEEYAQQAFSLTKQMPDKLQLQSYSLLARIAICRGELDKAAKYVLEIELRLAQAFYHTDATASAELCLLLFWQAKQDGTSIQLWLEKASPIEQACNHFTQQHGRNIARAQTLLKQHSQATDTLNLLKDAALQHNLVADTSRNAILRAVINLAADKPSVTIESLKQALLLTNQTGIVGDFLYDIEALTPLLEQHSFLAELDDLTRYRVNQLLKSVNLAQRSRANHFDEGFVDRLVHHPQVPELVRNSPLTQREWQVLGLIYSGLTNEQIAHELDVAGTTIKTHIRNLYQKLNIANRKQAIATAENLIKIVGN
ncbi:transcriptional regulator MalT [Vibrio ponticus]|uniref:HTH-type transcriptional regulator MalT n=1 Tax=Vibrio ponticus TaxID=265668 RepID=A0ABX3FKE6_9VIBR|nr:HTH-type transcriptional regulator MalT [Vibrio ponticus]OLQ94684.1 transcriptional regulator MalT [Vibrio ponticus]